MSETIGQQLKQTRESKGLTIQKVVQATHIRAPYIEALEADDFESLPSPVQARAFLRLYASYLGASLEEIITRQRAGVEDSTEAVSSSITRLLNTESRQPTKETAAEDSQLSLSSRKGGGHPLLMRGKNPVLTPEKPALSGKEAVDLDQPSSSPKESPAVETEAESTAQAVISSISEETVPPPVMGSSQSQQIYNEIGVTLRQRRESLSLTQDEIERHIHVRKHYLQALESGDFTQLPSSVQARGMLNNYAHFLDLDVDDLLLRFADGLQLQRLERQPRPTSAPEISLPHSPFKISLPPKLLSVIRRFLSADILVGGGLIVLLVFFAVWGTGRILAQRSDITPQPTAPSISDVLVSSPESNTATPEPSVTAEEAFVAGSSASETPLVPLPAAGTGAVNVVVIAVDDAWVRVTVDGLIRFEGRVTAGSAYPYDGNTQIEVLTGNGVAINILYNQSNMGPMGVLGEVVDRIYTANAILLPTATSTSTPTITPSPTRTLRPTATLRATATPRYSPTPEIP